jgi:3-deoxy-7-phosphoheptulonate synthase
MGPAFDCVDSRATDRSAPLAKGHSPFLSRMLRGMTGRALSDDTVTGLPRLAEVGALEDIDATGQEQFTAGGGDVPSKPFLIALRGRNVGQLYEISDSPIVLGRSAEAEILVEDHCVSRTHARVYRRGDSLFIEDLGSANGTYVNGRRVARSALMDGDLIGLGANQVFKLEVPRSEDQAGERPARPAGTTHRPLARPPWSPSSWKTKPGVQLVEYDDPDALSQVVKRLKKLPPLVASWEVEELKRLLAEAQGGQRFLLQGGDCAETFDDCDPGVITNKLKILLQMSLVLVHGGHRPVIRVGRFAGQYAKPRSRPTETRDGVTLPSYFGDIVNRPEFTPEARRADPKLLLAAYNHAAMTLNFIRAMSGGGYIDLQRPEYYDLSFFERAEEVTQIRSDNERMRRRIAEALHFVTALGKDAVDDIARTFFTSHEGLNLVYESAQTHTVPRREGFYDLTAHMPWIGERTRGISGAHIEFFRGVTNPIGVKLGPSASPAEVLELCEALNPDNERGKLAFITRMGASRVADALPPLIETVKRMDRHVLWVCDPMHGNTIVTGSGVKTRRFDDILKEVEQTMEVHAACDSYLGGVHFELTGENVTECIGGGLAEQDLSRQYMTACDPRLNYRQAVEMAFCIARRMRRSPSTMPPPPK